MTQGMVRAVEAPERGGASSATDDGGATVCPDCGHPDAGVVTALRRRVECAHAEAIDDGMGGAHDCRCRHDSHAARLVERRSAE